MISWFPTINASLNATAAVLLFLGWRAIKSKNTVVHKRFMIAALVASTLFLVSYLTYHLTVAGVTRYQGQGISRFIYFLILLTHTPLAVMIVPFCLAAVYFAVRGDFKRHVRITKWLLPVWMYVSVTGVLIYFMLYIF
ncbi:MAG: DUF420 domain-containing protein [Candidatus Omnitrophica bacterium]|nr:DUF420 domain-containing protein [Candidatus Omnitrophota bacterium]